jgi:DMSO/TMAO reductase YedYZ molybdopterin-dependent catalytic subunit
MNKSKTNRRDFLKITGASLTGLALVGAAGAPRALAKEPALRSETSLEQWLLNTGADELPANLFNDVLLKVR